MIQVQILVGNLNQGLLGLDDVIRGHQSIFANNSRLKKSYRHRRVSLCSSCQDASTDMRHDLLGPACDLTWPWPEVKYWPDHLRSPGTYMIRRTLTRGTRWYTNQAASLFSSKVSTTNVFVKTETLFWRFWPLAAKPLMLAQIWCNVSERTAQELSNVFSRPLSYNSF